jgi:hypothetical protein
VGTATLRPNGTVQTFGTVVGAASGHAALSDNSDASYIDIPLDEYDMATTAFPAGSQIRSVTQRLRYLANDAFFTTAMVLSHRVGASGTVSPNTSVPNSAVITTNSGAARTVNPDGNPWTQADIDGLHFILTALNSNSSIYTTRAHEAYIDVLYNERPTAVVTAPAEGGSVTTTTQPTVTWTYADPEADAQERYRVKVFSAAQYGAGGFDPETSTATWDSGDVFSAATSVVVASPLVNGVTYRAYVKVGDVTPSGYSAKWSTWDSNTFTIAVTPPGTPTVTAVAAAAGSTMGGTVTSGSIPAGGSGHRFELQRSVDGGASWQTVRGYTAKQFGAGTGGAGTAVAFVDYEVPRGRSVSYRARSTADVTGSPITSAFSAGTVAVLQPVDAPCAYLKSPSDPTKNITVDVAETRLASTSDLPLSIFYAEGRALPIVHSADVKGEDFDVLRFSFPTDAAFEAFEVLRARSEPLLLQLPHGDATGVYADREQRWVKLGKRSVVRYTYSAMNAAQIRTATVRAIEVAEPPVS